MDQLQQGCSQDVLNAGEGGCRARSVPCGACRDGGFSSKSWRLLRSHTEITPLNAHRHPTISMCSANKGLPSPAKLDDLRRMTLQEAVLFYNR